MSKDQSPRLKKTSLLQRDFWQPKRRHIFLALAGFNLIAISISMGMNHHLVNLYHNSAAMSSSWIDRFDTVSTLGTIASNANVAGNDVFENERFDHQESIFLAETKRFHLLLTEFAVEMGSASDEESGGSDELAGSIARTRQSVLAMERNAQDFFQMFRDGNAQGAGKSMAAFDRSYAQLNAALSSIRHHITAVIDGHLEEQDNAATLMGRLGFAVGVMITLMVAATAVYGRRIAASMGRMSAEREAVLREIQNQKFALDQHSIVSAMDTQGCITYVNEKFCEVSGYSRKEILGRTHDMIKSDEHSPKFHQDIWETIEQGHVWSGEIKNIAKDGSEYWVSSSIVPFKDETGTVTQYISIHTCITKLKILETDQQEMNDMMIDALAREKSAAVGMEQALDELQTLATTDKLTGLPNRSIFHDRLDQALAQARRDNERFAVLFFDFDRFKIVNDSLGHDVGDALLCDIADIFRRELRESDTVARFGGDEFVVLLRNLSSYDDAQTKAKALLDAFAKPHLLGEHQVVSTASIGLVTNETTYEKKGYMIRDADAAMYQAKSNGKAQVVVFDKAMHADALDRLTLEHDLRSAVEHEQLRLVYQPIVELDTGTLSGFEALIRWDHPERGVISPLDFIPIAEDTGLIVDIGRWVLWTAAAQIASWNGELDTDHQLTMNVNVSKRQLFGTEFLDDLINCRSQNKLLPGILKLEVTESLIADDRSDVVPLLRHIRDQGFPIVMDDFGTGLSSLGSLHEYPIDVLKIDKAFINALDQDRALLAVVASIASLGENLGMMTVAEGVETADIVGALQSIGCTWGQGYFFAKPMTPEDAKAYILDKHQSMRAA